jgi:hypothetical protein
VVLKRLTLLFVVLAIAAGVVSGMPLHAPNEKRMKCCDKARGKDRSDRAEAARLCCALNCTESTPTPSGVSFNFNPANAAAERSIADQIAALFPVRANRPSPLPLYHPRTPPRPPDAKYVQHHSFLI